MLDFLKYVKKRRQKSAEPVFFLFFWQKFPAGKALALYRRGKKRRITKKVRF
jgi:hypothetical protein